MMRRRFPDWEIEGKDWPNRRASDFVDAGGYRWHVQRMGKAASPTCLLLHGTGAATHSWRDVMPLLAEDWQVVAVDLPGHGFTRNLAPRRIGLPGMANSLARLLADLTVEPELVVGHSAGAAIGAQLLLDHPRDARLVGLNPALLPFPGLAAKIFPQLAMMLFSNPLVSRIFARMARYPGEVDRFLKRSTGSQIDKAGVHFYKLLLSRSGHCDGALQMMANWDLDTLAKRLPELSAPVLLIHADKDSAIPRSAVKSAADAIPDARFLEIAGVGHLAHEERPGQVVEIIADFARDKT